MFVMLFTVRVLSLTVHLTSSQACHFFPPPSSRFSLHNSLPTSERRCRVGDGKRGAEVWAKYKRLGFDTEAEQKRPRRRETEAKRNERKKTQRQRRVGREKRRRNCQKASLGGKFRGGQGGERGRQRGRQKEIQMC